MCSAIQNGSFVEWVDSELGEQSTGVKEASGSRESTKQYYKVRTRRSPHIRQFLDWYPDGERVYQLVELTPLITKVWHAGDGHLQKKDANGWQAIRLRFASAGEQVGSRESYFTSLFQDLPVEPVVEEQHVSFRVDDSKWLLDWMGEPLPGFDYKWL